MVVSSVAPTSSQIPRWVLELGEVVGSIARISPAGAGLLRGYLHVATGGRERRMLLADGPVPGAPWPVVGWRSFPLAEAFCAVREGEDYEIEAGDRVLEGSVLGRALLRVEGGSLVEIRRREAVYVPDGRGGWEARSAEADPPLEPRPVARRRGISDPIEVKLDEGQQAVVDAPGGDSLLVIGEAGFGKSTAALHRLARLRALAASEGRPFRALVLVPTEGLRRLSLTLLERLGADDALAYTVDAFLAEEGRRLFPDLPPGDSRDATAAVVWLKRSPYLLDILPAFAAARRGPDLPEAEEADEGAHPPNARRRDLLHLFGDSAVLDLVAARSGGELTARRMAEVLEHTHVQFSLRTEDAYRDVDPEHLITSDGASIDEGTPMQDAGTLDVEDLPVLFELHRLRAGGPPPTCSRWDHILLDEAQEVAPMELSAIGQALAPGGSISVVGDAHQQVDETAFFSGWDATLRALGIPRVGRHTLAVSHRCPPGILAFAQAAVAPEAAAAAVDPWAILAARPEAAREVTLTRSPSPCHRQADLIDGLMALGRVDPRATVALICRTPDGARALAEALSIALPVRLALGGHFAAGGGIQVTCVDEVKGLEFDYVVVPDLGGGRWTTGLRERRALYVALTRATWRAWLVA